MLRQPCYTRCKRHVLGDLAHALRTTDMTWPRDNDEDFLRYTSDVARAGLEPATNGLPNRAS